MTNEEFSRLQEIVAKRRSRQLVIKACDYVLRDLQAGDAVPGLLDFIRDDQHPYEVKQLIGKAAIPIIESFRNEQQRINDEETIESIAISVAGGRDHLNG